MQHHRILMRELENDITQDEPEVPSFGIDIAYRGLIKGYLTLWFCYNIWPEAMHSTRPLYIALLSNEYSP